jgi:signal transduction histidine kinase
MIVDDRLDTVLQTQAAGRAGLNTQLRQLIDLLGRTPDHAWADGHARALARLDAVHTALGDAAAAVLIRLCTLRSPRLIVHLAARGPRTALAVIDRARLDDADWLRLVPDLPIHARGALRHRRDLSPPVLSLLGQLGIDDFVLTGPEPEAGPIAATTPSSEPSPGVLVALPIAPRRRADAGLQEGSAREGIGAIVRRIEAFRRTRQEEVRGEPGQTRLPFAEDPAAEPVAIAVDIAIDAAGMITATDGVDPALLVGHMPFVPATPAAAASVDGATLAAFGARLPIVAGGLTLDGAARIAGAWRIDAVPQFGADGGQFTGYRARLRRPPQVPKTPQAGAASGLGGGDILQQLLHELRTPINAIQGFAELIQQQLLGPTPHQYRSLAASIAADAARMLAGFEDVERLVRLETGRARIDPGEADLAAIMTRLVAQLEPLITPREIRLRWTRPAEPMPIAIDPIEAECMLWRLLSTLVGAAAPGERITLSLDSVDHGRTARLVMTLPQALALRDDDALFAPDIARSSSGMGMLGHGFALRLAAAEIRAAGGRLERPGAAGSPVLDMTLPLMVPVALDRNLAAS